MYKIIDSLSDKGMGVNFVALFLLVGERARIKVITKKKIQLNFS